MTTWEGKNIDAHQMYQNNNNIRNFCIILKKLVKQINSLSF